MRVNASVIVDQSIREVVAYISNPCCWPEWMTGVGAIERRSARSLDIGETFDRVDRPVEYGLGSTWEVTEHEPPRLLVCRRIGGGPPSIIRQMLESVGGSTRLRLSTEGEVSGSLLGGSEVAQAMARQFEHDLGGLKELLERRDAGDATEVAVSRRVYVANAGRARQCRPERWVSSPML